jgi:hypothetical protein
MLSLDENNRHYGTKTIVSSTEKTPIMDRRLICDRITRNIMQLATQRLGRDTSWGEIGRLSDVDPDTLRGWAAVRAWPRTDICASVAQWLGVDLWVLFHPDPDRASQLEKAWGDIDKITQRVRNNG